MKKGVVITNVGRGDVIIEEDLFQGIRDKIIRGCALDVWKKEPLNSDSPFYTDDFIRNRIINTCHSVDKTDLLYENSFKILEKNLKLYSEGKELINLVDLKRGY